MKRPGKIDRTLERIKQWREICPDLTLRSTLIVGFPGETEEDFNELAEFIKEAKFDKLGVFTYSREEDTPADKLPNHLEEEVKVERQEALMMIQQGISEEKNNNKIGNKYEVLVEEQIEDNVYVGRTIYDAEEIDAIVYVKSIRNLQVGEFVNVVITDALEYDLMGVIEDEFTE